MQTAARISLLRVAGQSTQVTLTITDALGRSSAQSVNVTMLSSTVVAVPELQVNAEHWRPAVLSFDSMVSLNPCTSAALHPSPCASAGWDGGVFTWAQKDASFCTQYSYKHHFSSQGGHRRQTKCVDGTSHALGHLLTGAHRCWSKGYRRPRGTWLPQATECRWLVLCRGTLSRSRTSRPH